MDLILARQIEARAKQVYDDMNEDYMAFLLRLRRSPERPQWRASLENAHTGSTHHFASQEELFLFLTDQLAADPSLPRQDTGHDSEPTSG